jgi:hypothetical protein
MEGLTGRCLCGAIQYECGKPVSNATLCHCRSCRRASGSHVLGLVTVLSQTLRFTAGRATEYRSSTAVVRSFCPACGTPLTYWHEGWPNEISLTIGSLVCSSPRTKTARAHRYPQPMWSRIDRCYRTRGVMFSGRYNQGVLGWDRTSAVVQCLIMTVARDSCATSPTPGVSNVGAT